MKITRCLTIRIVLSIMMLAISPLVFGSWVETQTGDWDSISLTEFADALHNREGAWILKILFTILAV